jgi:hypothetical protein
MDGWMDGWMDTVDVMDGERRVIVVRPRIIFPLQDNCAQGEPLVLYSTLLYSTRHCAVPVPVNCSTADKRYQYAHHDQRMPCPRDAPVIDDRRPGTMAPRAICLPTRQGRGAQGLHSDRPAGKPPPHPLVASARYR